MYHDRPTFSLVNWSDEDVDEYRAGLETEEGVHAVGSFLLLTTNHSTLYPFRDEGTQGENT
jgi:hypothetical protein